MNVRKEHLEALKKQFSSIEMKVEVKDGKFVTVVLGEVFALALRQISKQPAQPRKLRFSNAGEVTLWQKKVAWDDGLAAQGDCRLVWVNEADLIDMGQEVKKAKA